jgi:hypothetical protein
VVERSRVGNMFTHLMARGCIEDTNLRPDWSLGESGGPSVGKGGESDVKSRDLQGGSTHMCRLRIDELPPSPVSKY